MAWIKPLFQVTYAVFGLLLLAAAAGRKISLARLPFSAMRAAFSFGSAVIGLWFSLHGYPFLLAVLLGIAIFTFATRKLTLGAAAAMVVALSMAWWLGAAPQPSTWWRPILFALLMWGGLAGFMSAETSARRNWMPLLFGIFALAGFALLGNMTQYQPGSDALRLLVHHQGAYMGPALQIRAGLIPFYDIPLQYGLGPTLSIAAFCGSSGCWTGLEFLSIASTLAMGLLILAMALATRVSRGTAWRVAVTAVVFAAVFLWPGFAFLGNLPASAPSTGGLRFLPATTIAFLLFFRRYGLAAMALAPAALWSPETAVMSMVVFGVHETSRLGFAKAALRTSLILGGSLTALIFGHHAIYGVWVQPDVITEYIRHVPLPENIDPLSNFLALCVVCALAAWNVFRKHEDQLEFRRDLITTCLLFAATSYYLGRSHANNVCNLMPFLALATLRTLDGKAPARLPRLPSLTVLGLTAATAALTFSPWYYAPFQHGFALDAKPLAEAAANLDKDMVTVRAQISNPGHLGIADLSHYNRNPLETTVWTSMDPSALLAGVPSDRRKLYIRRSAARLGLPGWVILRQDQKDWLDDFRVAYRVLEEKTYTTKSATYVVAHLSPLQQLGSR